MSYNGYYVSPVCRQVNFQVEEAALLSWGKKMNEITVYAIRDKASGQIYIGMTNNLDRRLSEHRRGQSFFTSQFGSFELTYQKAFPDYKTGREHEKYLKSSAGKRFLKSV